MNPMIRYITGNVNYGNPCGYALSFNLVHGIQNGEIGANKDFHKLQRLLNGKIMYTIIKITKSDHTQRPQYQI